MGGAKVATMVAPVIALVVVVAVMQSVEAATYKVGGEQGWKVPGDPSFYSKWASGIVFHVNDTLEFVFSKAHTVALVSKGDYDDCLIMNTTTLWKTSPASVKLDSTGDLYFICTIIGHCGDGQKLAVNVTASSHTPAAPPTPPPSSPPTKSTPSPSPPTTTSTPSPPPPPPPSNSGTTGSVTATFVTFGLVCVVVLLQY